MGLTADEIQSNVAQLVAQQHEDATLLYKLIVWITQSANEREVWLKASA